MGNVERQEAINSVGPLDLLYSLGWNLDGNPLLISKKDKEF